LRQLVLRKGQDLGTAFGVKISRILSFWSTGDGVVNSDQVIALVTLSGPGVNKSNDQALLLYQTEGSLFVLMREGELANGCPGARIGVINRVDVSPYSGGYAVIATLTGAPTGTELALFTGNVSQGNASALAPLRRPFLRLRKGQLYDNQPGKVRSFGLPTSNVTPSGAGGTGRGRSIATAGGFAFIVEFDNGVRQIMKGYAY
jgi:hypothetical protein